ncbi:ABC transporter ATP-binding protein [Pseudoalteromonas sp. XMcav11-Q]|uniref:ABC transporter ATP-binding protein n=1 Tax=Pseudoalteromonas sp. XMcav11-Q TaxID=3136665 RepID=UPI0032C3F79C
MIFIPEGIVFQKLKTLCAKQHFTLFIVAVLNVLVVISSFGIAYTVELLFQESVTRERLNYFVSFILLLLITFVLSNGLRQKLVFDIKEMLSNKLLSFAMGRMLYKQQELFDVTSPSKLYSNIDYDVKAINTYVHFILSIFFQASGTLLCGLIYLLATSLYMTLLSIVTVPLVILIIFKVSQRVSEANTHKRETVANLNSTIIESLSGIQSIKIHRMETLLGEQIESGASQVYNATKRLHSLESIVSGLIIFGSFSSVIFVLWVGGLNVIEGSMASGELVAFIMVLLLMSYSFASISDINSVTTKARNAVSSLDSLLNQEPAERLASATKDTSTHNKIELTDLSFKYQKADSESLCAITHKFKEHKVYSIIGRSGSGKSTLIKLIAGLYQSYLGEILIHQNQKNSQSTHQKVTMVEQDPFFFSGPLWQNITLQLSFDNVDELKLKRVSQLSNFDVVMQSNGFTFNSEVTLNAANLSGGEKQRLAIARALYSDSDILILDEATNSLDLATESGLHSHLKEIAKNKTVLIITHNLNSIYLSDQVIVVDSGQIVATDTPQNIIKNEHFRKISKNPETLQKEC